MSFSLITCDECKETRPIEEAKESWLRLHYNLRAFDDHGAGRNRHFCSNQCLLDWLAEQIKDIEPIEVYDGE